MDWLAIIERYGVAVTIVAVVVIGAWKACRFIGLRLFDGESGIVTRVANKHIEFMDSTQQNVGVIKDVVLHGEETRKIQIDLCHSMAREHAPGGGCDPRPLRRAGVAAADALVAIVDGDAERVRIHAEAIKRELDT